MIIRIIFFISMDILESKVWIFKKATIYDPVKNEGSTIIQSLSLMSYNGIKYYINLRDDIGLTPLHYAKSYLLGAISQFELQS